jgi:hypothetical protein
MKASAMKAKQQAMLLDIIAERAGILNQSSAVARMAGAKVPLGTIIELGLSLDPERAPRSSQKQHSWLTECRNAVVWNGMERNCQVGGIPTGGRLLAEINRTPIDGFAAAISRARPILLSPGQFNV